jgi:hypothetical protein
MAHGYGNEVVVIHIGCATAKLLWMRQLGMRLPMYCNYKSTYRNVLRHILLAESEFHAKNLIWPAGPYSLR